MTMTSRCTLPWRIFTNGGKHLSWLFLLIYIARLFLHHFLQNFIHHSFIMFLSIFGNLCANGSVIFILPCFLNLKVCSHVTKFSPAPIFSALLFSIVSMNDRQNRWLTHSARYSARHHWHNAKLNNGPFLNWKYHAKFRYVWTLL